MVTSIHTLAWEETPRISIREWSTGPKKESNSSRHRLTKTREAMSTRRTSSFGLAGIRPKRSHSRIMRARKFLSANWSHSHSLMSTQSAGFRQATAPFSRKLLVQESRIPPEPMMACRLKIMANRILVPTVLVSTATGWQIGFWSACYNKICSLVKCIGRSRIGCWFRIRKRQISKERRPRSEP